MTEKTATRKTSTKARPAVSDHKPSAKDLQTAEALGNNVDVTVDDITVTVKRQFLDDYEVLEEVAQGMFFRAMNVLFSPEDKAVIIEHCRDSDTGRVKYSDVAIFVSGVINSAQSPNA